MFEIEILRGTTWGAPSLWGNSFTTVEEAEEVAEALRKHDAEYYYGCRWRIVKVTREVAKEI